MARFIGGSLQLHLVIINAALSPNFTLSSSPLHTHQDSQSSLVVLWQRISIQEISLQITMKSCHFFFKHLAMPTKFSNFNFLVSVILNSVLLCPNLYSTAPSRVWVLYYYRRSVSQSVLVSSPHLGLTIRFLLLSVTCGLVDVGRCLWREVGSVFYYEQCTIYLYLSCVIYSIT
jgi:hypothetical protein